MKFDTFKKELKIIIEEIRKVNTNFLIGIKEDINNKDVIYLIAKIKNFKLIVDFTSNTNDRLDCYDFRIYNNNKTIFISRFIAIEYININKVLNILRFFSSFIYYKINLGGTND